MLRGAGYGTGMVGKWHVGLRYRQSNGQPAAAWPMPISRSCCTPRRWITGLILPGTPHARTARQDRMLTIAMPPSAIAPTRPLARHLHGRKAVGATKEGKLVTEGDGAYVLTVGQPPFRSCTGISECACRRGADGSPFFVYYPANSNHGPYTPDKAMVVDRLRRRADQEWRADGCAA